MIRKAAPWILLFACVAAQAKSVAMREVPLRLVAEYWKSRGLPEKLSPEENRTALLARVAEQTGAAETAPVFYTENESEAVTQVSSAAVMTAMEAGLAKAEWKKANKKPIKKNRGALKAAFGEASYLWAWCLFQLGDRAGAKNTLAPLFAAEADSVMKLKRATYGPRGGPLDAAEKYLRALSPLGEPAEVKAWNDELQKMKVHVSNLPQQVIMTERKPDASVDPAASCA